MKKILLLLAALGTTTFFFAQNEGNVGINTVTPTATLHVQSKANTAATQALKVDNVDGTNLLTINNDGTVSGTAAVNLSSGAVGIPKASGIFSGMAPATSAGYLSPMGNTFSASPELQNAQEFLAVAQTVPLDGVLDQMVLTLRSNFFYFTPQTVLAELYVNGLSTGVYAIVSANPLYPGSNYTSTFIGGSFFLNRGDLFAFRISGNASVNIFAYVSIRYTEQ